MTTPVRPAEPATYADWIARHETTHGSSVFGRCRESVVEMRAAFPELTEVRGHVWCTWGRRGHAWLVDGAGNIVDPTRAQFPGPVEYEPWKPGDTVRVGKCMNCGDDIWAPVQTLDAEPPRQSSCSPECETELMREFA